MMGNVQSRTVLLEGATGIATLDSLVHDESFTLSQVRFVESDSTVEIGTECFDEELSQSIVGSIVTRVVTPRREANIRIFNVSRMEIDDRAFIDVFSFNRVEYDPEGPAVRIHANEALELTLWLRSDVFSGELVFGPVHREVKSWRLNWLHRG